MKFAKIALSLILAFVVCSAFSFKKAKKEANDKDLTPKEKKELTDEEKEYKIAGDLFEESLLICEKTFGKNSINYKNLEENLKIVRAKTGEKS